MALRSDTLKLAHMDTIALHRLEPTMDTAPEYARIARAIEFLAEHAREQPSLARVAAAAGWSEYHFARVFRRWAGISPKQFLQHLSLAAAKQTLDDERSVLQAALDAGLSGPGRLHDLFVSLEAVTPGEYKSRGRGMVMRHGTAGTPFGLARIAMTERGIAFLAFAGADGEFEGWEAFRPTWREADWREDDRAVAKVAAPVWQATPGRDRRLTLWLHGTNFQLQVWQALLAAGASSTTSYAQLARDLGSPSACRADRPQAERIAGGRNKIQGAPVGRPERLVGVEAPMRDLRWHGVR